MLAKCAAWPASCIRVVRATLPEPTAEGLAREVKLVVAGCQDPSGLRHAGCGQWQKLEVVVVYGKENEQRQKETRVRVVGISDKI